MNYKTIPFGPTITALDVRLEWDPADRGPRHSQKQNMPWKETKEKEDNVMLKTFL
jgi:hypothetical protein